MSNFIERVLFYLRTRRRGSGAVGNEPADFPVDYYTGNNYSSGNLTIGDTSNSSKGLEDFNGGDFGGAGAGDSWSDSSSGDSGDGGSDGGSD